MKKNRLIMGVIISVFMIGSAFAAWTILLSGSFDVIVASSKPTGIEMITDFTDLSLDTSVGIATDTTTANFENTNGDLLKQINVVLNATATDPECLVVEGDCSVTSITLDGQDKLSGGYFTFPSGVQPMVITVECIENSCPQDLNVTVSII